MVYTPVWLDLRQNLVMHQLAGPATNVGIFHHLTIGDLTIKPTGDSYGLILLDFGDTTDTTRDFWDDGDVKTKNVECKLNMIKPTSLGQHEKINLQCWGLNHQHFDKMLWANLSNIFVHHKSKNFAGESAFFQESVTLWGPRVYCVLWCFFVYVCLYS